MIRFILAWFKHWIIIKPLQRNPMNEIYFWLVLICTTLFVAYLTAAFLILYENMCERDEGDNKEQMKRKQSNAMRNICMLVGELFALSLVGRHYFIKWELGGTMQKPLKSIFGWIVGMVLIFGMPLIACLVLKWLGAFVAVISLPIVVYCSWQFADWFYRKLDSK